MTSVAEPAALRPESTEALSGILRRDQRPLEVVGNGSKRRIGRPVDAEALDLSAFNGILDYRPEELVLSARAATPLDDIRSALAENRQQLAFEPPDLGRLLGTSLGQTIGGVLAANLSGSRRIAAGAARDHFLGVTAVSGGGDVFRAGGYVVKNVTGYDLPKLLAGSWGSLAVMTEVTLKLAPQAETELTLILPDETPVAAVANLSLALGSPHEISSAGFDPWRGSALRLEGFDSSVQARLAGLLSELGNPEVETLEAADSRAFWSALASAEALADWPVVWKISVPPSDAPRVVEAIAPSRFLLDWGGGLIWAGFDSVDAARVRGSLREGHAMLVKGPDDARACRQHPPAAVLEQVLDRVRQSFDPALRLNPGRMS